MTLSFRLQDKEETSGTYYGVDNERDMVEVAVCGDKREPAADVQYTAAEVGEV